MSRGRLPAALIAGLVLHGVAAIAGHAAMIDVSWRAGTWHWIQLVFTCSTAADAAAAVLLVSGTRELRRIALGPRWLATVALVGAAIAAVLDIGILAVAQVWMRTGPHSQFETVIHGYYWCRSPVMSVTVVAIAALGVSRDRGAARELLAALALVCLVRYPVPPMLPVFGRHVEGFAVTVVAVVAVIALVVRLGGRGVGPRATGWAPAGPGLQRVGAALLAPIVILIIAIPMVVLAVVARSAGLLMVVVFGVPAAGAVAASVLIGGLLRASTADAEGAPRFRLVAAAAAFATTAALDAVAIALAWRTGPHGRPLVDPRMHQAMVWTISLLGLGGVYLLLSALGAIAARIRSSVGQADLAIAGAVLTAVVAVAGWIAHAAPGESSMLRAMIAILVSVVGVSVSFAIARAARVVGEAVAEQSAMPTAVARVRAPGGPAPSGGDGAARRGDEPR